MCAASRLLDISLQGKQGDLRCWAVATNGEALYRMEVKDSHDLLFSAFCTLLNTFCSLLSDL